MRYISYKTAKKLINSRFCFGSYSYLNHKNQTISRIDDIMATPNVHKVRQLSSFIGSLSDFCSFLFLFFGFSTTNLPNNTTEANDADEEAKSSRYPHYHLRLHGDVPDLLFLTFCF